MPVAAVPRYLGSDFRSASPGLRFGLYLAVWTSHADQEREVNRRAKGKSPEAQEIAQHLKQHGMDATIAAWTCRERNPIPGLWEKNKSGANRAWKALSALSDHDLKCTQALRRRQLAAAAATAKSDQVLTVEALSTAPFTTGLGNEHPLENGFAFLNPYGLPYLPGSGVKGVVRQAARELAGLVEGARWEGGTEWSAEAIEALFGKEVGDGADRRGALRFWDVFPAIRGRALLVEVMTPHQTHYYQKGESPHESGQPNPIPFLTVPPGSGFTFHVECDRALLRRFAPELVAGDRWRGLLESAFKHAFEWLGFGAKTAVGYGALAIDERKREAARHQQETERAERKRRELEDQRKKEEAEERRRKQAELDALPESDKALYNFEQAIAAITTTPPLGKDAFGQLMGHVNQLADKAVTWPSSEDRQRAAAVIEKAFEHFGWTPSGLKSDKRRKQEKKRRELIARVKHGPQT